MRKFATALILLFASPAIAADLGGAPPAKAEPVSMRPVCFLEASAGKNITSTQASDLAGTVTISADGLQGGIGIGCDVAIDRIVIGGVARYDLLDVQSTVNGASIDSDAMWSLALRAGLKLNEGALAYGLIGVAGSDISYPGSLKLGGEGWIYGAGLEVEAFGPGLALFAEWNHVTWDRATSGGVALRPDSDIARVGVKLRFGG